MVMSESVWSKLTKIKLANYENQKFEKQIIHENKVFYSSQISFGTTFYTKFIFIAIYNLNVHIKCRNG